MLAGSGTVATAEKVPELELESELFNAVHCPAVTVLPLLFGQPKYA